MDVAAPRLHEAPPPTPPHPPSPPAGAATPSAPAVRPAERLAPPGVPAAGAPREDERTDPPPLDPSQGQWVPASTLKTGLTAADVGVRFEIDKDNSTVMVTMYERSSGEVLKRIPPREFQEAIERLSGRGLILDETR